MKRNYRETIQRRKGTYVNFDESALVPSCVPYFESQQRVRVEFSHGVIKTGRIGLTTGWTPAFILMLTSRSLGSMWVINHDDKIIAVQKNGKYHQVNI